MYKIFETSLFSGNTGDNFLDISYRNNQNENHIELDEFNFVFTFNLPGDELEGNFNKRNTDEKWSFLDGNKYEYDQITISNNASNAKILIEEQTDDEINEKHERKYDEDNVLKCINTYFLNFLVTNFINVILEELDIPGKFKIINYRFKKEIGKKNFNNYKNKTVAELLSLENSKKFKDSDKNTKLLEELRKKNDSRLNNILSKSYINIFKDVFYNNKRNLNYEDINLIFSKEPFDDFLEKKAKKDILYYKKIKKVIAKYYFPKLFKVKAESSESLTKRHNGKIKNKGKVRK